jgi:putative redox protein
VERTGPGRYLARTARGATLPVGTGDPGTFTPVELFLAALGACTAVDVDAFTSRRAEPDRFEVTVAAEKVRDERGGNVLRDVRIGFQLAFPEGAAGDEARAALPRLVALSHDKLCTVSRTVEAGRPVTVEIDGP